MGRRESRVRNISLILCRIGMGNFTMSRVISTLRKFARDQSINQTVNHVSFGRYSHYSHNLNTVTIQLPSGYNKA